MTYYLLWLIDSTEHYARQHSGILANAVQQELLKLNKYQLHIKTAILLFISTVLDPGLKLNYFKEHGYPYTSVRIIKNTIISYLFQHYDARHSEEHSSDSDDELYSHMFKQSRIEKSSSELENYLTFPLLHRKDNHLEYWKSQIEQFPCLSRMAKDFLSFQSTLLSVERRMAS